MLEDQQHTRLVVLIFYE